MDIVLCRFIPTSVGNGKWVTDSGYPPAVHPHERGERYFFSMARWRICGSSPRAWGTVLTTLASTISPRFIPTSVGNGTSTGVIKGRPPVHPHERGERCYTSSMSGQRHGSSPRAWGTGLHRRRRGKAGRFIPTSVGNGPRSGRALRAGPVHPHERGERRIAGRRPARLHGSSPRAWGTDLRPAPSP